MLKQSLKPLHSFKKIDTKHITKPHLFKDAPKLTTFVRSAGNRTKELWNFIDEASRADVMLVELKTLGVDVAAVQETHFTCGADWKAILTFSQHTAAVPALGFLC